ncbi:hypothetical protein LRP30_31165 [Bradyrhizobium sp. C-145]|uniref:hypothetical protein n=1 Tax=Bradyrhizobium sp. C-145 TaxID=574727 RepID=UPI00201B90C8|nr:hypothetical protein [Bradyrhizobium sp. C-145]UQR61371.1 hypothetical protein LRP30_31165 [Bradyrhizobium sp. C-145]
MNAILEIAGVITSLRKAAQQKADMRKLADLFEVAVGNVVETVSSASTELEAPARSLRKTADSAQHQSSAPASASEQASSSVQSLASCGADAANQDSGETRRSHVNHESAVLTDKPLGWPASALGLAKLKISPRRLE